jgi:hypothetical protein
MTRHTGILSSCRSFFKSPLKPLLPMPSLSRNGWISVLILASKWRFLHVRARAIVSLKYLRVPLKPSEKIQLGRDQSIPSWVIDGFVELVQATTITDEEALKIDSGAETTAYKLFRIRELRLGIAGELLCHGSVKTKVKEIFKEELDRLRSTEKIFSITNE